MTEKKKLLFKVENLQKYFPIKKTSVFQREQKFVRANKDISIEIYEGETLGLVGESGCGKSTFGRTLIQLYEATGGSSVYYGAKLDEFMPAYVLSTVKKIPSVFPKYKEDEKAVLELEASLSTLEDEALRIAVVKHNQANNDFVDKYKNMFRLAGGLLSHSDLNEVSKVLETFFVVRAEQAKIRVSKDLLSRQANAISSESQTKKLEAKIAELDTKIASLQPGVDKAVLDVQTLSKSCSGNEDFDIYEAKRDNGIDLTSLTEKEMRRLRQDIQIIFQDPYSSLDPRLTVGQIIGEGLLAHGVFKKANTDEYNAYIIDIMEKCGLNADMIYRYPHQFSGGQRQRIGIARALAMQPQFVVCDEAVSALDVSIQAQVLELLQDLKDDNNLTYLFITHDLGVVKYISDRIGVMYFGHLVEIAPAHQIFSNPQHPYTKALLAAIPRTDDSKAIQAQLDEYYAKERGDVNYDEIFDFGFNETSEVDQDWYEVSPEHFVACRLLNK